MNKKYFSFVLKLPFIPIVTLPISCDNKKIVKHNILFEIKMNFLIFHSMTKMLVFQN